MPDQKRLLELALKGLEAERARIDDEIVEVRNQIGSGPTVSSGSTTSLPKKRRKMSAAAKRRISEGMKRRYAEMRKPDVSALQSKQRRQRGGLTAAGRQILSDKMKARWAAKRRAAKKAV